MPLRGGLADVRCDDQSEKDAKQEQRVCAFLSFHTYLGGMVYAIVSLDSDMTWDSLVESGLTVRT